MTGAPTERRASAEPAPRGALEPRPVLHVRIVTGTGGGPEKTILSSPRHLAATRYPAVAAYLLDPDDPGSAVLRERARARDCPLVEIADRRPLADFARVRRELLALCRERRVAVWHGHDYKSNLLGLLVRRKHPMKLVTTVHGWVKHTHKTPLYYAIDRWCLPRYDQVVCVSQDLFDAARAAGVAAERLVLVENAIDTDEFRRAGPPAAAALRARGAELATPPGRLVVGAVGRLSEEKGFDLLVRAVERLCAEGCDLELWIAGEGDRAAPLAAQIGASRWRERLRLLGFRADTHALFEALDVFALSSLREGLPNVVLEAMATEVPVLATRCGGMEAFARDGEDALLVATGSVDALADGLRRLAREPELRARLARAARARIEREGSFRARMQRLVALYDGLFES